MNYVCKIATLDEIIKRMDYLIKTHPNNNLWIKAKENAIRGYKEKSKIMYIGLLIMFFNIVHLIFVVVAITLLHLQILEEEKFLINTFSDEYIDYKKKVNRYFGIKR